MHAKQFDALAKSLGRPASRRAMTSGLASGALASLLRLAGLPESDADAAKRKTQHNARHEQGSRQEVKGEGKKKKKVTLCHSGQTIKVAKKKKKKHLRHGDTLGACQTSPLPPPVGCTPNPNACGNRECGQVDNGCGTQVSCGTCTSPETCDSGTGQCGCTANPNPCAGRQCGSVDNGCGTQVPCGANNGGCAGTDFCQTSTGQCVPAACQSCTGCCDESSGTCPAGNQPGACGFGGAPCEACNPEVACVNGECTCTRNSCAQGCCTIVNGRPFCDNTLRPCGDTCIPRTACCAGLDPVYPETVPGCLPNETCAVNSSGFGECRCGSGGRCQRNQGCCTQGATGPICDTTLRPCGNICIDKTQCCREGQVGCDDGVACTAETCQPATGTGQTPPPGICVYNETAGACPEACEAGFGYGNYFPELQREVRCGSVNGQRCYCWRTTEDENVCTQDVSGAPCRRSSECGDDEVCIRSGLTTGSNVCAPICA